MISWTWFGKPGHFIDAVPRFHLHTHVGSRCISTVGELMPPVPVGRGRLYETVVFLVDSKGNPINPINWEDLEVRGYSTAAEAEIGHLSLCVKHSDISFTDEVTQS